MAEGNDTRELLEDVALFYLEKKKKMELITKRDFDSIATSTNVVAVRKIKCKDV